MTPGRLGPYRLLRFVGRDDGGTVYEADEPGLPGRWALTVLHASAAPSTETAQSRVRSAVLAAAKVRHPNIVPAHDFGCEGHSAFVTTAFVEGETLEHYLARVGRLPALQALALVAQLLSALEYAHRNGLVHSAIHPKHLLIARNGQLKVTGYGWVAAVAQAAARPGVLDSAPHMAPELALGGPADHRSDLYSAAVVGYQLLTGALPFQRGEVPQGTPASARNARPALPFELDAVFERALARSPEARYRSAAELGEALRSALGTPVWVRQKDPALPAATASVQRHEFPKWAPDVAAIATPDSTSPNWLVRRAGLTLAIGCAAFVVWIGGLSGNERSLSDAATAIASQADRERVSDPPKPVIESQATTLAPTTLPIPPLASTAVATPARINRQELETTERTNRTPAREEVIDETPEPARAHPAARKRTSAAGVHAAHRPAQRAARQPRSARLDHKCRHDSDLVREMCTVISCATAEFRHHPVCIKLHADAQARHQLAESRGAP
ncbi:serine/threonine protein kinase [Ramlibacter henchirensis]|nr:serine/threonine-protein kinase [Ramlibacter henchirensis]